MALRSQFKLTSTTIITKAEFKGVEQAVNGVGLSKI